MNDTIKDVANHDYVVLAADGSLTFDWQMLINNFLMLGMTMVMAYISKRFECEIQKKESHREVKMRKLDSFHQEKINILKQQSPSSSTKDDKQDDSFT